MVEQTALALAEASSFSIIALAGEKLFVLHHFYFLLKISRSFLAVQDSSIGDLVTH